MINTRKVVVCGPMCTQSGYGHHAREVITNIIEQRGSEWDVKLVSLPWGHTPMTYPISTDLQLRIIPLPLTEQPDVWVQISVPTEFQAVGKYNIGVTAGTEGDICPAEWIDKLNAMQLVIVPSEFTKSVFVETAKKHDKAITCNLQVISEYFDESVYTTTEIKESVAQLDEIPEQWAFLSVGHWLQGQVGEDRKNIGGMVHCFFNTFKDTKNQPALIMKCSGATYSVMDRMEIEGKINQVGAMFGKAKLPNVYLIHGELSDAEMNALYNHSKVKAMVSFTKAEGFGRPLLEFATTGKPILAPHYSGQADFLKKDFICALPGTLTPIHATAQNQFLIGEAKWFSVDYGYAGKMMQEVVKNYKTWLELAKRQRYFVNTAFTRTSIAKTYETVLEIVDASLSSVPKSVELKLPTLPKLQKI